MCESFRENYLVRIYRRDAEDPERITGLVEFIEAGEKKSFATFDDLIGRGAERAAEVRAEERQDPVRAPFGYPGFR